MLSVWITGQTRGQPSVQPGQPDGLCSICSANRFVIEAALAHALAADQPVLIESTSNQVNQYGGYIGLTPGQFMAYVHDIARQGRFPLDRIIVGGDHLGPNPWQNEPAAVAMDKSRVLIRDCVRAGYVKIHLDASMKCADDDPQRPLDKAISAGRAAEMALVAETTFREMGAAGPELAYIIGTEVPLPGGSPGPEDSIRVTTPADVQETIEITRAAFLQRGLEAAWERVIAVVVQPGVEFTDDTVFEYNRAEAAGLSHFIEGYAPMVFEAHSTDYQTAAALRQMVEDHFAILKVGPALTFAFREAVFSLAMIEEEWLAGSGVELSRVRERLDEAMMRQPGYWQKYYPGAPVAQGFARKYSLSDRSRYYWVVADVEAALARLIRNLQARPLPLSLLSQYLPVQYNRLRNGLLPNEPRALILDKIGSVLADYSYACGWRSKE